MTDSPTPLPDDLRFKAAERQVSSDLGGEVVILDLAGSKYFGLDEVGASAWNLLERGLTVSELTTALLEEYDVDPARCRRDIEHLLRGLESRGLIVRDGDAG